MEQERKRKLRLLAENKLEASIDLLQNVPANTLQEVKRLAHELSVYSIEIEMQNDELIDTQVKLESAQKELADLFEYAPVGYIVINEEAKILKANNTICKMLNIEKEKLIENRLYKYAADNQKDELFINLRKLFAKKETIPFELTLVKTDQQLIIAQFNGVVFIEDGERLCRISITNITELKKSETDKKDLENRFQIISSVTSDYTYEYEVLENSELKLNWCIGAFKEITGFTIEESINNGGWQKLIYYEDWEIVKNRGKKLFRGTEDLSEFRIVAKDSSIKWISDYAKPILKNGKVALIVGGAKDITEYKEKETELQKNYLATLNLVEDLSEEIAERKRVEQELKISGEKYETLINNLQEGIWQIDENAYTVYVNERMYDVLGYKVEEMKGKPFYHFMDKIGKRKAEEYFEKRKFGVAEAHEFEFFNKNGNKVYTLLNASPIVKNGKFAGALASLIDITLRKNAEILLNKSEEKFRIAFKTSPDAISLTDSKTGVYLEINKGFSDIMGFTQKEVLGKTSTELNIWKNVSDRIRMVKELTKHGIVNNFEAEFVDKSGKTRVGLMSANMIKINERPVILSITRDITERKEAELEIIEEKNKAEIYLESTAVMMLALNLKGVVTMINSVGAKMLGYSKKYIIGKKWIDNFIPEENRDQLNFIFNNAAGGKIEKFEYVENPVLCRYNKIKILAWYNNIVRNESGEIIGLLSSASDITESLRLKKELEESNKRLSSLTEHIQDLRENERAILARDIHDDLGQALTALKIDLFSAKKKTEPKNTSLISKLESAIDLANYSIKSVQNITSELRPGLIDDLGVLPAIEWYANQFTERSGIKVKCSIKISEEDIAQLNKINLFRIVQEAFTNILRHSEADKVTLKFFKKEESIVLTITDNGKGISTKSKEGINSFGLMSMRERAEYLKGNISVNARKKGGTEVKLIVPFN